MTDGVTLLGRVEGLERAKILGPCVLGHPGATDHGPLVLEDGVVIRAFSVLYEGSLIGAGTSIGHGALVREGNVVGDECSIGSGVQLEPGNRIGARSRLHSGCFLSSSTVGTDVFCGPRVVFLDDPHPPCPRYQDCVRGPVVHEGAAVGGCVTLLPGVVVGARSLVGAGSVVTRSVEPGDVVVGNPARPVGRRDDLACFAGFYPSAYARVGAPTARAQVISDLPDSI